MNRRSRGCPPFEIQNSLFDILRFYSCSFLAAEGVDFCFPFAGLSGTLLGLWYTGKTEFVVGVEGGLMTLPVANRDVDEVDALFGIITIKYYF